MKNDVKLLLVTSLSIVSLYQTWKCSRNLFLPLYYHWHTRHGIITDSREYRNDAEISPSRNVVNWLRLKLFHFEASLLQNDASNGYCDLSQSQFIITVCPCGTATSLPWYNKLVACNPTTCGSSLLRRLWSCSQENLQGGDVLSLEP